MSRNLELTSNAVLVDLTPLYSLASVDDDVTIRDNLSLTDAAAQALVDEIDAIGGTVSVSGN